MDWKLRPRLNLPCVSMINVELYAEVDYKDDRAEDYDYEDY